MNRKPDSFLRRLASDQSGQILPWVAILMALLFAGFSALVVDVGRGVLAYHMLQAATDAAALAGVSVMPTATASSTVTNKAIQFSAVPGKYNANTSLLPGASMVSGYPNIYCSTTATAAGVTCNPNISANAIRVKEQVTLPMYFASWMGFPTMTIGASATASMKGSQAAPYNVAIVIDTTASMAGNDNDASCKNTRIYCALAGVQDLMQVLSPCTTTSTKANCTAFDSISLFTFPNIQAGQASKDTTCPTSNPAIPNYYTPVPGATWTAPTGSSATYQVTDFLNDYSSTNTANQTLDSSSSLVIASGGSGKSNCKGLQTPGGDGTYYAGAIYAAQSALMAEQAANPLSQNSMIILSDGDASSNKITTSGTAHSAGSTQTVGTGNNAVTFNYAVAYPSTSNQCQQAIDAAKNATAQGTTVTVIAYGAQGSGCSTDTSGPLKGLSPCSSLTHMASDAGHFYSDATAGAGGGSCPSVNNPGDGLAGIFGAIAASYTKPRLMADGTP